MKKQNLTRRNFIRNAAISGSGLLILPSGTFASAASPNNKLNIGLVGCWGRAQAHWPFIAKESVVAMCDVNDHNMAIGMKGLGNPKANTYRDWRVMLDKEKNLDAIVVCTPDHTHAHLATWALNRDLHVFLEKPIGNSVHEARTVRQKWDEKGRKVATQVGTQRHAYENFRRVKELVRDGAIGELKEVHAWGNRVRHYTNYPTGGAPVPSHIDHDLWCGPSPYHPYDDHYWHNLIKEKPGPGSNCLMWNQFWDFGTGQVGDMGSHTMDLAWNAIDGDLPVSATAEGEPLLPDVAPGEFHASYILPANDWRGKIRVSWWQGGMMPKTPRGWVDLTKIGHGAMFKGTKGFIVSDFNNRLILPYGKKADMSYYNRRNEEDLIPDPPQFHEEWVLACKNGGKTSCDFDYNGRMMEMMLLGLAAYQAGEDVKYDGKSGSTDSAKANRFLKKEYREGWPIDG
jgi:predicted dehydrogenase